jgi:hypothetical protein
MGGGGHDDLHVDLASKAERKLLICDIGCSRPFGNTLERSPAYPIIARLYTGAPEGKPAQMLIHEAGNANLSPPDSDAKHSGKCHSPADVNPSTPPQHRKRSRLRTAALQGMAHPPPAPRGLVHALLRALLMGPCTPFP